VLRGTWENGLPTEGAAVDGPTPAADPDTSEANPAGTTADQ
jgi:hypothetical protein